jgi:Protein of unknown function (DUF4232)
MNVANCQLRWCIGLIHCGVKQATPAWRKGPLIATSTVIGSLLLTAGVTLTACGASPAAPAAGNTATTAGTSLSASSPASPSTAIHVTNAAGRLPPRPSSPAASAVRACANADLTVRVGRTQAGLGHVGLTVVFTNGSHHLCTLYGYPGIAGVNKTGRQVTQALRSLSGYLGGSYTKTTVRLAPGGRASALVEGTDNPAGTATCPIYPSLLVTAPNQTRLHALAASMPGCSRLEVHPVVAGATGRART